MNFKIAPQWWPILLLSSPVLFPLLVIKFFLFLRNRRLASGHNAERVQNATPLGMPEVEYVRLSVLVDWKKKRGYLGDAAVSYFLETNLGSLLFDVGHGPENPTLTVNAKKMGFDMEAVQALAISHLHKDHMGGMAAARKKEVMIPEELWNSDLSRANVEKICHLPAHATCGHMKTELATSPKILSGGIATTGPLARSLFFFGYTEEQALVIRVKDHGLVVITGCGHPSIETILSLVRKMSNEPLYAIVGGLHFPMKTGRGDMGGIRLQRLIGTGKPPWGNITIKDLHRTAERINRENPKRVLLSGHDTDDYALEGFNRCLEAEV